ncbi:hypothetical protein [Desulfogranum marinum]|uniref:hypothetical protein n=1 Tax=Desulfogranum marinum TaxID=453220 RepID=UPI0029C70ABA|nr:hypothetical protein [Desulfogranum marinum]
MAEIPILKISNATNDDERKIAIVEKLSSRGQSKPRKVKTLSNTIHSLFTQKLKDDELASLIEVMKKKYIMVN